MNGRAPFFAAALILGCNRGASTPTQPIQASNNAIDTLFVDGFESGDLSAWDDNYRSANKVVVTDPSLAHSGTHYLKIVYPAGTDGGGALSKFLMPGHDTLYGRYFVRFPSSWQGGTKLLLLRGSRIDNKWSSFGVAGQCPSGSNFFATNVVYDATRYLVFYSYYYGMPKQADNVTCWGVDGSKAAPPSAYFPPLGISTGSWHLVEFEVLLNALGQSNGRQRFWLDGTLKGEWSGIEFRTTNDLRLNVVTLESSAIPASASREMYVDDVLVTTARP